MKTSSSISLFLAVLLWVSPLGLAQTPVNCDQLRTKVEKLEKTDLNTMSPSLRLALKEGLLKLYTQFSECLKQDISAATEIRNTVVGTDVAQGFEDKLRMLIREKDDIDSKITMLSTALNASRSTPPSGTPPAETSSGQHNGIEASRSPNVRTTITQPQPPETATAQQPGSCEQAEAYEDAPRLLTDIVGKAALDVVQSNDHQALSAGVPQMLLYTIMDASSPASSRSIRSLEAYQYLSETARTDKQLGAAANSNGAVSAIEKPGFASLLGFAVENGAINKENDGTNLTLSTSLYSLYSLNKENTAETYARAGILNRIGVAATFAVDNTDNDLANARRNNLSEWSVKARLFGDRSTRSASFQKFWNTEIRPLISARLQALGGGFEGLSRDINGYDLLERALNQCLKDAVQDRMDDPDYVTASPDEQKAILTNLMIGRLKANVFDRVQSGQIALTNQTVKDIEMEYLPKLKSALDNLVVAGGLLEKKLDDLKKGPLGTFAYTNYRIPTGSDYSETKFLFEQEKGFMGPLKLNGNLGLSIYNRPDRTLNQQRLRDFSAALSFEGESDSPFTEAENRSKITYSFVGRYERLFENRRRLNRTPDIGTLQFVTDIPLFKGLSLPFSITYSTATEEEKKQGFRFNFGTRFDMDKLFELLRANSQF